MTADLTPAALDAIGARRRSALDNLPEPGTGASLRMGDYVKLEQALADSAVMSQALRAAWEERDRAREDAARFDWLDRAWRADVIRVEPFAFNPYGPTMRWWVDHAMQEVPQPESRALTPPGEGAK